MRVTRIAFRTATNSYILATDSKVRGYCIYRCYRSRGTMLLFFKRFLWSLAFVFLASTYVWGQGIFATLTGVVTDPSGAVVSGAKVRLRDAGSGSERATVTDSQGYYTFASVPV